MERLVCNIKQTRALGELIKARPAFAALSGRAPRSGLGHQWRRSAGLSEDIQVVVIGKSGQGKSTLLNRLLQTDVFATSDVTACTSQMDASEFKLPETHCDHFLSFADMPGIGESESRDEEYMKMYRHAVRRAHVVLWLLRADQRDYGVDLKAFSELFGDSRLSEVIMVINGIDMTPPFEPVEPFRLSGAQRQNLAARRVQVQRLFGVPKRRVVAVSAAENVGLNKLSRRVAGLVDRCFNASSATLGLAA